MSETILKAGAVIFNPHNKKILLLYRTKQNDWTFPKGHVEEGENSVEAMKRELAEETELTVDNFQELPSLEYSNPHEGDVSLKMYLVRAVLDSLPANKIVNDDLVQWFSVSEAIDTLSYDNLKKYLASIRTVLENLQ